MSNNYICSIHSLQIKMQYKNIREEELKNKVGQDFFKAFNITEILGNIDFCVSLINKLLLFK